MKDKLLIVDDSVDTLEILRRNLSKGDYEIYTATSVKEALAFLDTMQVDLVITDLKMPEVSGMELVRFINENLENTQIMMITGYASLDSAIEAVKTGAEEYLPKPFTIEELKAAVEGVLKKLHDRRKAHQIEGPMKSRFGLVGESKPMQKIFRIIQKAASVDATVLITGESGTGKELVSRAIHYSSSREQSPFVPVNCGGIPEELLESELFGHVKGAFTGASETRAGFFQTADGGSILLDEIGETSKSMQVKLLRALQDKQITMVGSRKPHKVDVRIIAATNKNLMDMVSKGTFRDDLFYRLNVINIEIPPLRERGDDILLLTNNFLERYSKEIGRKTPVLSDDVIKIFKHYEWPGNVRELENILKRLVVMAEGDIIETTDLPQHMRFCISPNSGIDRTLKEVEAEHIRNVMAYTNGNKTHAAKILEIDRKTLRSKINEYGLKEFQ
ncbi:MAG: sigma-54-dependent transcriptional regulator [Candidatus Zixiibacteriota bacterium]